MFLSNKLDMLDNKCSEYVLFIFYRAFINFILEYMIYVFKSSVYQNASCHDFFLQVSNSWPFFVPSLGWLSDPFKWLSDLQLGDEMVTLNHLVYYF